jgi:hypothetical protein
VALEFQRTIYLEHNATEGRFDQVDTASVHKLNDQSCNYINLMKVTTNCYQLHSVQENKLSIAHEKVICYSDCTLWLCNWGAFSSGGGDGVEEERDLRCHCGSSSV